MSVEIVDYKSFIAGKHVRQPDAGFAVDPADLPARLFDFQRSIVRWALARGRAAIFADTGLGKTAMQLAWASEVAFRTGKPVLILTPLAVAPQTVREAGLMGLRAKFAEDQTHAAGHSIVVTNYQKLHLFDTSAFGGIVLDESSILKSFTGAIKRQLCESFAATPYRLACTATPAPNDLMEIGNHAAFLGIMESTEMLTRWFINDLSEAGVYRLKGHAEGDFWRWLASWGMCLSHPADLGFAGHEAYSLPDLKVVEHVVKADLTSETALFAGEKLSATQLHRHARKTAVSRAAHVADLIAAEPNRPWLVWVNTDYDADALLAILPTAVDVRGSDKDAHKVDRLTGFSEGRYPILITKPTIAGFGLNWQHCSRMAFCGLNYSWEAFYQAARRCWRFGQSQIVHCHVVVAETEVELLTMLKHKQEGNVSAKTNMIAASAEEIVRATVSAPLDLIDLPDARVAKGEGWTLLNGDCVESLATIPSDTVGFSVFSPPFAGLYIYSPSTRDMGNAADDEEFFRHFSYLVPELLRVTMPGRLCAVHCKDLPLYRNTHGEAGLRDFPGELIRLFQSVPGWTYHSRVTIWKCPVVEMERTKNNGLLHKTVKRDSSQVRQGMADYLLVFRKTPGDESNLSSVPIEREGGFTNWPGDPALDPRKNDWHPSPFARRGKAGKRVADAERQAENERVNASIRIWQRLADPVWWHIDQMDVLNYRLGRDGQDEKHICPLQLGVIREAVELWSEPGDLVLSPFAGIGSEGYEAVRMGRRFVGVELKPSYFNVAIRNLQRAEREAASKGLFDGVGVASESDNSFDLQETS